MEQQQPGDAFLKYAIALEYIRLGNNTEAEKQFELFLRDFPDYLPTYYQAAKFWEETGNTEAAIDTYNKGIELARTNNDNKTLNELKEALMLLTDE